MSYIDELLGRCGYPPEDDIEESEILTDIKILHTTHKAVLIQHKNRQAWFPKSVVYDLDDEVLSYKYHFDPAWKSITQRTKSIASEGF